MGRKVGAGKSAQVNIPLAPGDDEVLRALTFLEHTSAAKVLGPVVERFLRRRAKEADVQLALQALAVKRAHSLGAVRSLDARRSAGAGHDEA